MSKPTPISALTAALQNYKENAVAQQPRCLSPALHQQISPVAVPESTASSCGTDIESHYSRSLSACSIYDPLATCSTSFASPTKVESDLDSEFGASLFRCLDRESPYSSEEASAYSTSIASSGLCNPLYRCLWCQSVPNSQGTLSSVCSAPTESYSGAPTILSGSFHLELFAPVKGSTLIQGSEPIPIPWEHQWWEYVQYNGDPDSTLPCNHVLAPARVHTRSDKLTDYCMHEKLGFWSDSSIWPLKNLEQYLEHCRLCMPADREKLCGKIPMDILEQEAEV